MMTSQDFQDVIDRLQKQYPDFTTNQDSLQLMLDNNFKPVYEASTRFISMCDIEADKIYLWISTEDGMYFEENSENLFDNITVMKLLYSPGYQIAREEEDDEDEEYLTRMDMEETVRRGQEVYGTDLFPNLTNFAGGQWITCNKRGAESLRRQINRNTGWDIYYSCPLILLTRMCPFYRRHNQQNPYHINLEVDVGVLERHSVLYRGPDGSATWNGWSGPFLLYELLPPTIFSSFNYPTGLPLNR